MLGFDVAEKQREHWRKLHTTTMDADSLATWINEIPSDQDCQCAYRFTNIIKDIPPRFDDWNKWTWQVHNAVNAKLGKPEITWREACKQWQWNLTEKEFTDGETQNSS